MRRWQRRAPLAGATVAALGVGAAFTAAGSASAQGGQDMSEVSVVHGIPGQPVDVHVDGDAVLEGFAAGEIAGPLELPAGTYDIAVTGPGGDPDTEAILSVAGAEVPGGANLSLVAHLDEGGEPTLTPFVNEPAELAAGEAQVTVRHTAAAPAVDVRAGGEPVFAELTNPNQDGATVEAGTIEADLVLAGTDTVALGPAELDLAEGTSTIVYAIGSADEQTLELVVQTIEGMHSPPAGVPSGTGGLAATGVASWWYGLATLSVLMLIGGALWSRSAAEQASQ
jgi:hypothetical protein